MSAARPTRVVVDGFELNAVTDGVEFRFERISGWTEPAGIVVDQTQREQSHGQFGQVGHRTGKLITYTGRVYAPRELMPPAIDSLNAILGDGSFGRFEFHDRTDGMKWTTVQLGPNAVRGEWDGSPTYAFQLELLAPDSYRYGTTSTASTPFGSAPVGAGLVFPLDSPLDFGTTGTTGTVTVANPGKAAAAVKFTVAGPTPSGGFEIVDTSSGKRITYLGAVPTGSTLVLDGATGSVIIDDGPDRSGDTIVEAWPQIPAGGSTDFLFTPLGGSTAATLTAEVVATYW